MQAPRRVLFIAYQFPPSGGIGVHRVVKFTKYLPDFGWESSVLTVANPSVPLKDESLLRDVPASTEIVRARTLEPSYEFKERFSGSRKKTAAARTPSTDPGPSKPSLSPARLIKGLARGAANLVFQPDMQVLWGPNAYRAGCELLRRKQHDVIVATAPPFSSFLVGARLSKKFGIPLVLDYRDEWGISNTYWENKQQSRLSQRIQQRMQSRLLRQATMAIATTPSSRQSVKNSAIAAGTSLRCEYIYNGFDPEDFTAAAGSRKDYGNGRDLFRLAYVGTLWNLNPIEPLVKAIEQLHQTSPLLLSQLELVIAGRRTPDQEAVLDRLTNTGCRLVRLPFISHDEAVRLMQTSDCLTLLNAPVPGAERIVNGKIFEYLACEKPFLLISPQGDMWDMTADCPYALPCDPLKPEQIALSLATEMERHQAGIPRERAIWSPAAHGRRQRAEQLAAILDGLTGANSDFARDKKPHSENAVDTLISR
ncbi:glycosyltransferase [Rubinisphaera margarita]|uniref:glycosyltransferase n=1 Tax=Rubinisphaera margarita TaxID=2909586 RepID=UPI001EE8E5AA|nr:glycosyltransferase [Rubinisphaera margarita]MCG6158043.1 glycosyltransferase [Rubinisphaera margarita]